MDLQPLGTKRVTMAILKDVEGPGAGIPCPMGCEWVDLCVTVKTKGKAERSLKQLVKPTSGYAMVGDILAVMGPSGSGKTTLLDAISGRMRPSMISGSVTFGGCTLLSDQICVSPHVAS